MFGCPHDNQHITHFQSPPLRPVCAGPPEGELPEGQERPPWGAPHRGGLGLRHNESDSPDYNFAQIKRPGAQIAIHSRPKCRIYSNAAGARPGRAYYSKCYSTFLSQQCQAQLCKFRRVFGEIFVTVAEGWGATGVDYHCRDTRPRVSPATSGEVALHSNPYQPSATSSIIISVKPRAKKMVPMFECSPSDISGISSSTTTYSMAPAAKAST